MSMHGEAMRMGMWKKIMGERLKGLDNQVEEAKQSGKSTKELELIRKALERRHGEDLIALER